MFVTAARASEILEWADAPRASVDLMALYQRALDPKRAPELSQFIKSDKMNIVPGAVIIATAPGSLSASPSLNAQSSSGPTACTVTISMVTPTREVALRNAIEQLNSRLSASELNEVKELEGDEEQEKEQLEQFEEEAGDDEDSGLPSSYLTIVAADLEEAARDWDSLEHKKRAAIEEYLRYAAKPGMIIDGQHRVYAAKNVNEFDVILPIVLIDALPMAEQVFHFYVLNNKAKPLTKTDLRRTISTALTATEIDTLWSRLKEAGVDPDKVRLTHLINTDDNSPFKGLVDFGLAGDTGFIKENVAYQLVDNFVSMPARYRALGEGVPAWDRKGDKIDRLPTFYAFWHAIMNSYPNAWSDGVEARGKCQFFMKVSMLTLQSFVLDNLLTINNVLRRQDQPPPFEDLNALGDHVVSTIEDLPEEFFMREWTEKQMDTSQGRRILRAAIQEVIDARGKNLGNRSLFKTKA